jgi:hypothetical protein
MKQWEKMTNVLTTSLPLSSPQKTSSPKHLSLLSPKTLPKEMTPSKIELTEQREQEDDY